jgi:hypothetical protein
MYRTVVLTVRDWFFQSAPFGHQMMSLYFAFASRKYACLIASKLTMGWPQIAAVTARL